MCNTTTINNSTVTSTYGDHQEFLVYHEKNIESFALAILTIEAPVLSLKVGFQMLQDFLTRTGANHPRGQLEFLVLGGDNEYFISKNTS